MFPDLFRDDVFTLETSRLFLRWPKASDAEELCRLAGDRRIAEMTAVMPHPYKPEHAVQFIVAARTGNAEGSGLQLAVALRGEPEKLIGIVGLRRKPNGDISLGYWVGVEHWGRGYATEAAQAMVDAAFLYCGIKAIAASVRVINPASRRVLEHCGFQFEGSDMLPRPAWGDAVPGDHYRLNRALWQSLKGWRAPLPRGRELLNLGM